MIVPFEAGKWASAKSSTILAERIEHIGIIKEALPGPSGEVDRVCAEENCRV
jgi:hypothetical protein